MSPDFTSLGLDSNAQDCLWACEDQTSFRRDSNAGRESSSPTTERTNPKGGGMKLPYNKLRICSKNSLGRNHMNCEIAVPNSFTHQSAIARSVRDLPVSSWMNKDEVARKLTKVNQLMNELIFAFMQTGMSYRQAEEEVFGMLNRKRLSKETENAWGRGSHVLQILLFHRSVTNLSHSPSFQSLSWEDRL